MSSSVIDTQSAVAESFRDATSTISKGKRVWLFPKKQRGKIFKWRSTVAYTLLMFLLTGPFFRYDGHAIFMFNFIARKFIIFGIPFWPQDFFLFGLSLLTFILFIILFTSIFGRWWCGWACPQTIFMEFLFRRIEYFIEGDAEEQRRLKESPTDLHKFLIKLTKFFVFYFLSFLIANIFLAYIIGADDLWRIATEPITQHLGGFISIIVFSFVFYFVFAYMREQVCLVVCPYGRLQGVLLDKNSVVISYDHVRGEPRGKITDKTNLHGDCIDCKLCVNVCPTGIDIRNGTQLECINCAACIDACDSIMTRVNKPEGLIRYASHNSIVKRNPFRFTTRMWAYLAVFTILFSVVGTLIIRRPDVQSTVLRAPGQLFMKQPGGKISNLYTVTLVNKTFHEQNVELKLVDFPAELKLMGASSLHLLQDGSLNESFLLLADESMIKKNKNSVTIEVYAGGKKVDLVKTTFIGPVHHQQINSGNESENQNPIHHDPTKI